jgi:hypothetical protein
MKYQECVNSEGLTWCEWFRATFWRSVNDRQATRMLRDWNLGVDPTEWRALLQDPDYDRFHTVRKTY